MSPALTEKFEIFIYSQKNSNPVDHNSGRQMLTFEDVPHVYPLATSTERISLDPEVFNEDIEDPVDFIIALSNEFENEDLTSEHLRYIADTTNEAYGTTYTEDDVQRIINDFIEAITAE